MSFNKTVDLYFGRTEVFLHTFFSDGVNMKICVEGGFHIAVFRFYFLLGLVSVIAV